MEELIKDFVKKPGMKKFYYTWRNAKARCTYKPSRHAEALYYGLEVWGTFKAFKEDMLESYCIAYQKDSKCSLDRKDNYKGYTKDNCRWASQSQQMFNKRDSNRCLAVSPDNNAFVVNSIKALARDFCLSDSRIGHILNNNSIVKSKIHKDWYFFIINDKYREFIQIDLPYICIGEPFLTPHTFDKFIQYQKLLGYAKGYPSIEEQMSHVNQNCLALVVETGELLQELPSKPWRPVSDQPFNTYKALEELIDMLFFALNIGIAMEWTYPEIILAMAFKQQKNKDRIRSGYNNVQ